MRAFSGGSGTFIALICVLVSSMVAPVSVAHAAPRPIIGCPAFDFGVDSPERGVLLPGESVTCSVSLGLAPGSETTVTFDSNMDRLSFEPSMMRFTTGNWSVPQTLTVTAVDDHWLDPLRSTVGIAAWAEQDAREIPSDVLAFRAFSKAMSDAYATDESTASRNRDPDKPPSLDLVESSGFTGHQTRPVEEPEQSGYVWIGAVQVHEPEPRDFLIVHPRSSLRDVEGGMPGVIWVRPIKQPRFRFWAQLRASKSLGHAPVDRPRPLNVLGHHVDERADFDPQHWRAYQPLPYGREDDLTRQSLKRGFLALTGAVLDDGYGTNETAWRAQMAPAIPGPFPVNDDWRRQRPQQKLSVRLLDNDSRSQRRYYVNANGSM
jgi:hypothetical protein